MKTCFLSLAVFPLFFISCENRYYTTDDFQNVEKIDAHFHIYTGEIVRWKRLKR